MSVLNRWRTMLTNPRTLIWMVVGGGLFGFGGVLRLLTDNWLVIGIAVLAAVLVVLAVLLVRVLMAQERDQRRERGVGDVERVDRARSDSSRAAGAAGVQEKIKDALATLRARIGNVNELPWVLLLGEPGAGKSAALAESGLEVPAEYARSRVFGATQDVDVMLANEAIAVDVAGRVFEQADADGGDWNALLRALASGRPGCPINGILFALAAPRLLGEGGPTEELARTLRRRLNEAHDALGVYLPVYIVITKADRIEGFVETAGVLAQLGPTRLAEAFGWTNDHPFGAPEDQAAGGLVELADRLQHALPELLLREPDAERRRRVSGFAEELREFARAVSGFIAVAFRPSVYDEPPFLRGVYLTSARPEGTTLPLGLRRLGHEWARATHAAGERGGLFLRDLFREIVVGDAGLALPDSRIGPLARRLILVSAGVVVAALAAVWGMSFWQNLDGTQSLAAAAGATRASEVPFADVETLRAAIEREETRADSPWNQVGFRRLATALGESRIRFVEVFDRHYDRPLRARLAESLERRDGEAVRAAVVVASDMDWLATRASDPRTAPDLGGYLPRNVESPDSYTPNYAAYVRWLPEPDWRERLDRARAQLETAAPRILDLALLEELTRGGGGFAPVSYPDPIPNPEGAAVPGIYTRAGFEGLVGRLLAAVERTEALGPGEVARFRRSYADRFDAAWRRYLLDVPDAPRPDPAVRRSAYVVVVERLSEHARTPIPREGEEPEWITSLRDLAGGDAVASAGKGATELAGKALGAAAGEVPTPPAATKAPWDEYVRALDAVALDVDDGVANPARGLDLARAVAGPETTSFEEALSTVRRVLPRASDATAAGKLRRLLELPVLDGLSAVLASALRELDRRWTEKVATPFGGELGDAELASLYGRQGELARFRSEELAAYYDETGPRPLAGEITLPLGPAFQAWMKNAGAMQRILFGATGAASAISVRLGGLPTKGLEGSGLFAKRRELELVCPEGVQRYEYREGTPTPFAFSWTSSCQELALRVLLTGPEGDERRIVRHWRGPLALPTFLREAVVASRGSLEWKLEDPEVEFSVPYTLLSGGELRELVHAPPPPSLGS